MKKYEEKTKEELIETHSKELHLAFFMGITLGSVIGTITTRILLGI